MINPQEEEDPKESLSPSQFELMAHAIPIQSHPEASPDPRRTLVDQLPYLGQKQIWRKLQRTPTKTKNLKTQEEENKTRLSENKNL